MANLVKLDNSVKVVLDIKNPTLAEKTAVEELNTYLQKISKLLDLGVVQIDKDVEKFVSNCNEAKALVADFKKKYIIPNENVNASWKYLLYHADLCLLYADLAIEGARHEGFDEEKERFRTFVFRLRPKLHHVLDFCVCNYIYEVYLNRL
jgi:hypothetical protein